MVAEIGVEAEQRSQSTAEGGSYTNLRSRVSDVLPGVFVRWLVICTALLDNFVKALSTDARVQ